MHPAVCQVRCQPRRRRHDSGLEAPRGGSPAILTQEPGLHDLTMPDERLELRGRKPTDPLTTLPCWHRAHDRQCSALPLRALGNPRTPPAQRRGDRH